MSQKQSRVKHGAPFQGLRPFRPKMELHPRPTTLTVADEDSLLTINPGDIIFLDDSEALRPMVEPHFFAVLGCPGCGTPGLITAAQYRGLESAICGSEMCSCRFRILEGRKIEYLPAS